VATSYFDSMHLQRAHLSSLTVRLGELRAQLAVTRSPRSRFHCRAIYLLLSVRVLTARLSGEVSFHSRGDAASGREVADAAEMYKCVSETRTQCLCTATSAGAAR
jgi:hypothetical protein